MTSDNSGRDFGDLDTLAAAAIDAEDVQVLQRMAVLYDTLDPVPTGMVERIQFGITLDALHAEIAELELSGDLAGVRSGEATEVQTVTFTSANLTTMITITPISADEARIDGWAAPGDGAVVELRSSGGVASTTADADGRFVFERVPRGLAQLMLRQPANPDQPPVVTPSIEI